MKHRYREARERAGLSMGQAAALLNVSPDFLTTTEDSEGLPAAMHLQLADLYRVSACWLYGHETQPDLGSLAAQAKAINLPESDWLEIKVFAESHAVCLLCSGAAVTKNTSPESVDPRWIVTTAEHEAYERARALAASVLNGGVMTVVPRCPCGAFCAPGTCRMGA